MKKIGEGDMLLIHATAIREGARFRQEIRISNVPNKVIFLNHYIKNITI